MTRETVGKIVFLGATGSALALYALTAPDGLPWNYSSHLALASLGEIVRLPAMPHRIWGFYVRVFGGSVALAVTMAAVAAGLLGAVVNRYVGWRFAAAASLLWIFLPPVWNRAVTGERSVVLVSMAVVALWGLNAVGLWVTQKARLWRAAWRKTSGGLIEAARPAEAGGERRRKVRRVAGRIFLGAACACAAVSAKFHDYRLGEAASAFARGVVESARGRVIVMNGLCDDQVVREKRERSIRPIRSIGVDRGEISLRNDDAYRAQLLAWVRREFPSETNLWVAAEVSPQAFVAVAAKAHPEMFYHMNGTSATLAEWERRWKEFQPYLDSSDPFVPTARRMFAREGNAVANALVEKVKVKGEGEQGNLPVSRDAASTEKMIWRMYKRVYEEVDPGNVSALVNMNEMIRRGYPASGSEKLLIEKRLARFFENREQRRRVREIVRAAGPVRADPAVLAKMADEARARLAARVAAGEPVAPSPEAMTLAEWHNEMIALMNRGETEKAGRLARLILSNPKWRGHLPANAVMGGVMARAGDYVAGEAFYRTATATTNRIPARVLNGYADTLLHLGKLEAAEKMARRAVAETDDRFWMARLTLAEILLEGAASSRKKDDDERSVRTRQDAASAGLRGEIRALLKTVPPEAPEALREKVRAILREVGR